MRDEDLADLYSDTGLKSVPPTRILAATTLQLTLGLSDRKLEEGSKYDDREAKRSLAESLVKNARARLAGPGITKYGAISLRHFS